jgi:hypothetical protein
MDKKLVPGILKTPSNPPWESSTEFCGKIMDIIYGICYNPKRTTILD